MILFFSLKSISLKTIFCRRHVNRRRVNRYCANRYCKSHRYERNLNCCCVKDDYWMSCYRMNGCWERSCRTNGCCWRVHYGWNDSLLRERWWLDGCCVQVYCSWSDCWKYRQGWSILWTPYAESSLYWKDGWL